MAIFAYIRVSTDEQTTENQKLKMSKQGFTVDEWFAENGVSGKVLAHQRPVFSEMMRKAQEGDTICAISLCRLGRNTEDILATVRVCKQRGLRLRVMDLDGVDLTSTSGKILVTLMALIAEVERDNISTRTTAGLARTKAAGTVLGRPLTIPDSVLKEMCKERKEGVSLDVLAGRYGFNRSTIDQTVKKWKDNLTEYKQRWQKQQEQASLKQASMSGS